MKETGTCSLCGAEYAHYGNNPEPLKGYEERCCDDCNDRKVIPARLGMTPEQGEEFGRQKAEAWKVHNQEVEEKTRLIQETFGAQDE